MAWRRFMLVVAACCFACSLAEAQTDSTLSYYPLAVGDTWQYVAVGQVDSAVWTVTVTSDTVLEDGKTWKIVRDSRSDVGEYYERVDSVAGNVYHRGQYAGLLDSLRASVGDWVRSVRLQGSAYQQYVMVSEETILGVPTLVKHAIATITPDALNYGLALGLGLCYQEYVTEDPEYPRSTSTRSTLQYARIGGAEFGALLSAGNEHSRPSAFLLSQNYPNPFNPGTTISFAVSAEEFVSLVVYDLLGREVARLVQENTPGGKYSVSWNASGMPSGIYFYRLTAGRHLETRKFTILR